MKTKYLVTFLLLLGGIFITDRSSFAASESKSAKADRLAREILSNPPQATLARVRKSFININEDHWDEFRRYLDEVGILRLDIKNCSFAIEAFALVPYEHWEQFKNTVQELLHGQENLNDQTIKNIIHRLASLSNDDREYFISEVRTYNFSEYSGLVFINLMMSFMDHAPNRNLNWLIPQALRLIPKRSDLVYITRIIHDLSSVSRETMQPLVDLVLEAVPKANASDRSFMLETIKKIPQDQWGYFMEHYRSEFVTPFQKTQDKIKASASLVRISREELNQFTQQAHLLFGHLVSDKTRVIVLKKLCYMSQESRQRLLLQYFHLLQHIRYNLTVEITNRIFLAIIMIPDQERDGRLERLFNLWLPQQWNIGFGGLWQILETPLQEELLMPAPDGRNEMAQLAQRGQHVINVHSGGRDQRTINVLKLLWEKTSHLDGLTKEQIKEVYQQFSDFLNLYPQPKPDENIAKNRKHIEKREKISLSAAIALRVEEPERIFPGLLIGLTNFEGWIKVSGYEIMARFWEYSNQINDEKDQENYRISLLYALADSVNPDGTIVCHEGKIQRLATRLHGRLEGAWVDHPEDLGVVIQPEDSGVNPNATEGEPAAKRLRGATLLQLFFMENTAAGVPRQELSLDQIWPEVDIYIAENPECDADELRREVANYLETEERLRQHELEQDTP